MTDNPQDLARLLLVVGDALERRGAGDGVLGAIRRSAAFLATVPVVEEVGCPVCAGRVPRAVRGRPRVYCSTPCRRRAEQSRRNERMGT